MTRVHRGPRTFTRGIGLGGPSFQPRSKLRAELLLASLRQLQSTTTTSLHHLLLQHHLPLLPFPSLFITAAMSEYIGSRISLISKSDIKYIGTLHEINSENHTVALESVSSYGTEGRKGDPSQEIPGSDHVYEYIVFRGSDVKELTIVAPPAAPKENEPPRMPDDPAILGVSCLAPRHAIEVHIPQVSPDEEFWM